MNESKELSLSPEETDVLIDAILVEKDPAELARMGEDLRSNGNIGVLSERLSRMEENAQSRIRTVLDVAEGVNDHPGYTTSEQ